MPNTRKDHAVADALKDARPVILYSTTASYRAASETWMRSVHAVAHRLNAADPRFNIGEFYTTSGLS